MANTADDTMTAQEVFDAAVTHLFTMPKRATYEDRCMYRTTDGNRCLVGALIRDDEYDPQMDNCGVNNTTVRGLDASGLLPERLKPHLSLLTTLQDLHDMDVEFNKSGGVSKRSARPLVRGVAEMYGLSVPAIAA